LCEESDNINTHWFIKIKYSGGIGGLSGLSGLSELLSKLNSLRFNKDNNIGALSISKQDIIKKYNSLKVG
jgi:hypothetical protein